MTNYYDFEVTLLDAQPKVWRRFLIRSNATFMDLHEAIQLACGWQNSHLFIFRDTGGGVIAGLPSDEDFDEEEPDAADVALDSFFGKDMKTCLYEYDFGDSWKHNVVRMGSVDLERMFVRRLIDGGRAFPPEDCGGPRGYKECVRVAQGSSEKTISGPASELRTWLGDWDPERFDLAKIKKIFDR